jgi:Xaa-Pro aminopeptidase
MHGLGHWLGIDVHDVGDYKTIYRERILEPGMVITVEPGLYIDKDADVPVQYKGIGIRIEDDILITPNGNEVFTAEVPKEPELIEALMNS